MYSMKFYDFISSSSIVMVPDLKTRPRTDERGDDSARAVVNRPSIVESFTLQLSRKDTLAFMRTSSLHDIDEPC